MVVSLFVAIREIAEMDFLKKVFKCMFSFPKKYVYECMFILFFFFFFFLDFLVYPKMKFIGTHIHALLLRNSIPLIGMRAILCLCFSFWKQRLEKRWVNSAYCMWGLQNRRFAFGTFRLLFFGILIR